MKRMVVDASVAISWGFPDEVDTRAGELLRMLVDADPIVPAIWPLEMANAMVMAERRKRLTKLETRKFLSLLSELAFEIDAHTGAHAFNDTLTLARRYDLTAYDACYLELALREEVPLVTFDAALRRAGRRAGARLLPA